MKFKWMDAVLLLLMAIANLGFNPPPSNGNPALGSTISLAEFTDWMRINYIKNWDFPCTGDVSVDGKVIGWPGAVEFRKTGQLLFYIDFTPIADQADPTLCRSLQRWTGTVWRGQPIMEYVPHKILVVTAEEMSTSRYGDHIKWDNFWFAPFDSK